MESYKCMIWYDTIQNNSPVVWCFIFEYQNFTDFPPYSWSWISSHDEENDYFHQRISFFLNYRRKSTAKPHLSQHWNAQRTIQYLYYSKPLLCSHLLPSFILQLSWHFKTQLCTGLSLITKGINNETFKRIQFVYIVRPLLRIYTARMSALW